MAATYTKQWSTRTREKITGISKGFSEVLAGLAEPVMRYATIYLMISTGIPFLRVDAVYWACIAIVIVAPEFVLLGALTIGEQAYKTGSKSWSIVLFIICGILACIMVATFIDIFIVKFDDMSIKILNFSRCLVAVAFSFSLNKLEAEADQQDHQVQPSSPIDYQAIAQSLLPQLQPTLDGIKQNILEEVRASTPECQPVNHEEVARAIAPMFEATVRATIVREVKATLIPIAEPPIRPQIEARATCSEPPVEATLAEPKATLQSQSEATIRPPYKATSEDTRATHKATTKPLVKESKASDKRTPEERLEAAYQEIKASGKEPTGRTLASAAKVGRDRAGEWLDAKLKATSESHQKDQNKATTRPPECESRATLQGHPDTDEMLVFVVDSEPVLEAV